MLSKPRKKKKKHLKLQMAGGKTTVQIGSKTVKISVTIPREVLLKRLSE